MWYGRNVINPANLEAGIDESPQSRLSAWSRSFNLDLYLAHSDVGSLFRCVSYGILGSKRRTFPGSLETKNTRTAPGDDITLSV